MDAADAKQPAQDKLSLDQVPEPLRELLQTAVSERATDLHLDPVAEGWRVRHRVDGILHPKRNLDPVTGRRLLNQIKVASDMKHDRSFAPLERLLSIGEGDRTCDVRVTVLPVMDSEAVHLRFLSAESHRQSLTDLGLSADKLETLRRTLDTANGLILVAGATGSGKTTTLYALAEAMDLKTNVGVSIEDPVEFKRSGLRQVEVDEHHGLSMSEGLKTLLRMDPDVIVIGEIRDAQSAMIAARAALSGVLVMATVHAPNAATAVFAMQNYGVPRYVLGSALRAIITQDLLPTLCPECKQRVPLTAEHRERLQPLNGSLPTHEYQSAGCEACHGYRYRGRVGVFEVLPISKALGYQIAEQRKQGSLAAEFRAAGCETLVEDALRKAGDGRIGLDHVWKLVMAQQALDQSAE